MPRLAFLPAYPARSLCTLARKPALISCFLTTQILFPLHAALTQAESASAGAKSPELITPSPLSAYVAADQFQSSLKPLVSAVERMVPAGTKRSKEELNTSLAAAKTEGERLLKKTSRGYHDEIYELLGLAHELAGKNQDALVNYQRSLQMRANNDSVLLRSAAVMSNLNRCKEAIPVLQEAEWRSKSNRHEVLYLLGQCHIKLGDSAAGKSYSEKSIAVMPNYLPALKHLVSAEQESLKETVEPSKRGEIEVKIASYQSRILLQDPSDRETALSVARQLYKNSDPLISAGRIKEAEQLAKRFVDQSKFTDAESVRVLFDIQLRQGRFSDAEATLKSGLEKNTASPLLKEAAAQLAIQRGVDEQKKAEEAADSAE